jgi:hypothetical protein
MPHLTGLRKTLTELIGRGAESAVGVAARKAPWAWRRADNSDGSRTSHVEVSGDRSARVIRRRAVGQAHPVSQRPLIARRAAGFVEHHVPVELTRPGEAAARRTITKRFCPSLDRIQFRVRELP